MELCEFIKERRNIHQNIRAMIRGIRLTYGKAQDERVGKSPIGKVNQATQVTPVQNTKGEKPGKRLREKLNDSTGQQTPKRKTDSTPKKAEFMKSTSEATRENTAEATSRKGIEPSKGDAEAWRKVEPRKRNYRGKIRPEVIFISKRSEGSYADILRKVKADPELTNLGDNVSRIRRSQKGDLMLELKKSKDVTADKFLSQIGKTLGQEADIRASRPEITIICKDIDEITTKEEVREALEKQFDLAGLQESVVKTLRKAYRGTQTAIISLPAENALKLLAAGRVRIGWVMCRLREQVALKRCFRCLGFGHIAKSCTNPNDRSKQCRRCGVEGHISKDCGADPNCLLCKGKEGVDHRHIAGSSRCPEYRRALSTNRR
ncbi:unnamed protein product [Hermetia illucens]|uniref:CCHC-type domain-containing protein n=1 Tax=Hermetia illucens TaxID=343691 RepID=A0A7R8UEP8_HERIL|nr:unnamed protein product [Hermetia illucens]